MALLYPAMREIPAGTLQMGFSSIPLSPDLGPAAATFPLGDADERPYHTVSISSFSVAQTEVTNLQFEQFDPSHSTYRGRLNISRGDNDAVLWVSWNDAVAYCEWLTATVGAKQKPPMVYRLPTEAEWEHAARGNTSTRHSLFWTGDTVPPAMRNRNDRNGGLPKPGVPPVPTKVGRFTANSFGLHDTIGNVEEWVHDYYGAYGTQSQRDPCGPLHGSLRVTRGGSHSTELYYLRTANRAAAIPGDRSWFIGFRVAASRVGEGPACSTKLDRSSTPHAAVTSPSTKTEHSSTPPAVVTPPSSLPPLRPTTTPMPPFRRTYVHIPASDVSKLPFAEHNHDPTIVSCPAAQGGGLLASWFSTACGEPGRCTGIVSARLEEGAESWSMAAVDIDVADRCQCCPSFLLDRESGVLHQFSAMAPAGDWSGFLSGVMGIVRSSTDCGRTWSSESPRIIWPSHGVSHQVVVTALRSERTGEVLVPTDHWGASADPYDYCFTTACDQTVVQHAPSIVDVPKPAKWTLAAPGANQSTYGVGYNHTGSHHSALVELRNGSYLAIGRGHPIGGAMPISFSIDGAHHWSRARPSAFPAIHGGQRAIMIRLGKLSNPILLCSFANPPAGLQIECMGTGCPFFTTGLFCALSLDEGNTWPFRRPLTTNLTANGEATPGTDGELFTMAFNSSEPDGYLAATVDETDVIHLITSRNHYAFNRAWLEAPVPPPPQTASATQRLQKARSLNSVPTDPEIYNERRRRQWCGPQHEHKPLPGLDDSACAKRFPPFFDRDFSCPSSWSASSRAGFAAPTVRADALPVSRELNDIVPPGNVLDAKIAVGIIRRETTGGIPFVRYLGNGAERVAHQPWSSSKAFAAAAAASRLRNLRANLGLDAFEESDPIMETVLGTNGELGHTSLADLITIIASYDVNSSRPGVTSNALGAYFHALGGHAAADEYLHDVIGASAAESFGGNYGEPVPPSAGFTLVPGSPPSKPVQVKADPVPQPPISNHMSCLTMAEWLRRIVCGREELSRDHGIGTSNGSDYRTELAQTAIHEPLTWKDSSAILYGAQESMLFPGLQWGGLSMGTDVYVQSALNLTEIDARSSGRWRIYSKLGAGVSSTEHPGEFEITLNAYACLPSSKHQQGLEFVLSAAVAAKADKEADAGMLELIANVTAFLLTHYDHA